MKLRAAPINYSNTTVDETGKLKERKNLLDERIVEGYACMWGVRNSHGEKWVKGAFAKSIKENGPGSNAAYQIKFRDEHGRACALFEILEEREDGLYFKTKPLDDVSWCDDLLTQLRSGTINNFSNGFRFLWDRVEWDETDDSLVIYEARLMEISAVAIPSDMETYAVRAIESEEDVMEETEDWIKTLSPAKQLEARRIITKNINFRNQQHKSPIIITPKSTTSPKKDTPIKKRSGIDYKFLTTKLKTENEKKVH